MKQSVILACKADLTKVASCNYIAHFIKSTKDKLVRKSIAYCTNFRAPNKLINTLGLSVCKSAKVIIINAFTYFSIHKLSYATLK